MQKLTVVAVICGALTAFAGTASADATRAKGLKKAPSTKATSVAHPKGTICPKTGRLILTRK